MKFFIPDSEDPGGFDNRYSLPIVVLACWILLLTAYVGWLVLVRLPPNTPAQGVASSYDLDADKKREDYHAATVRAVCLNSAAKTLKDLSESKAWTADDTAAALLKICPIQPYTQSRPNRR